jgi:hypothetical protein
LGLPKKGAGIAVPEAFVQFTFVRADNGYRQEHAALPGRRLLRRGYRNFPTLLFGDFEKELNGSLSLLCLS